MSVFKRRRFPTEVILLCVRWYCKYGISYCDVAEKMQERGVMVDYTSKYLNNIVESDHGALKQVIRPVRGFQTM